MPILPIVHYPEAVLLEVGKPVGDFNEELERLVADMFVTMEDAGGVGLAAAQDFRQKFGIELCQALQVSSILRP